MRPLRLALQGFGSFRERAEIVFNGSSEASSFPTLPGTPSHGSGPLPGALGSSCDSDRRDPVPPSPQALEDAVEAVTATVLTGLAPADPKVTSIRPRLARWRV